MIYEPRARGSNRSTQLECCYHLAAPGAGREDPGFNRFRVEFWKLAGRVGFLSSPPSFGFNKFSRCVSVSVAFKLIVAHDLRSVCVSEVIKLDLCLSQQTASIIFQLVRQGCDDTAQCETDVYSVRSDIFRQGRFSALVAFVG